MKCVRDAVERVNHIVNPGRLFSLCEAGFASSTLEYVENAVPTCLWCVAGVRSSTTCWQLLPKDNMRRRYIEEHCEAPC